MQKCTVLRHRNSTETQNSALLHGKFSMYSAGFQHEAEMGRISSLLIEGAVEKDQWLLELFWWILDPSVKSY